MRLVSSEVALRGVVALACAEQLTLSRLSDATSAPVSSTKRALEILIDDAFVTRTGPLYALAPSHQTALLVQLAEELLDPITVIHIAGRATGQIEFVGRGRGQLLVVLARAGDPMTESRLARLFERQAGRMETVLCLRTHDDVRRELDVAPERRDAYRELDALVGDPDEVFPDRRRHGATTGARLGRPNPLLRMPSNRALRAFRKLHGIRSARIFGSAVRTDFRPDSDVDVAIDLEGKPSLGALIAIEQGLEQLFGRDVDVILTPNARPRVRAAIEQEGVEILR